MQTVITIICHSDINIITVNENLGGFNESKLFDTREAADAYAVLLQARAGGPKNAEVRAHDLRRRAV
jgi:hypothetical protein